MGMTIDKAIKLMIRGSKYDYDGTPEEFCEAYDMSIEIMRKYQMFQADYENRLKADMLAMLTEIQTEIEELPKYRMTHDCVCVYRRAEEYMSDVNNVIQQKIDKLKEVEQ